MDGEKSDNNINVQRNGNEGVFEDFPKEIVHLLMKTHPIKPDEQDSEFSTMPSREGIRGARKHRPEETQKDYTYTEKEAKVKRRETTGNQIEQAENSEQPDFNQTMAVIFDDDDDDMVQLVRHKSRKKGHSKGFSTKTTNQFEEIEKTIKVEKVPRPNKKGNSFREEERTESSESSGMLERKKIFDHHEDDDETVTDKKSILDNFFADNDDYEYDGDNYEKKIKAKNIVMIGGIVALLVFAVLFIKTISLTGKLNKAETKIEEYDEIQAKNEELKLNVLTLEEEVGKLKNGEEVDGMPTDEADGKKAEAGKTPTGEFDTYTVVKGDNYWIIADKVYGNGADYQKILDFNSLTENDNIKPGEVLKIPKQ